MEKELDIIVGDSLGDLQDHAEGDEVQSDGILKAGGKRSRLSFWRICGIALLVVAACAAVVAVNTMQNESALLKQSLSYALTHLDEDDSPLPQDEVEDPNNRDLAAATKNCKKRTAYAQGFPTKLKAATACLKRLYARGCDVFACCISSDGTYYDYGDGTYYSTCACGTSMLYDVCPDD